MWCHGEPKIKNQSDFVKKKDKVEEYGNLLIKNLNEEICQGTIMTFLLHPLKNKFKISSKIFAWVSCLLGKHVFDILSALVCILELIPSPFLPIITFHTMN